MRHTMTSLVLAGSLAMSAAASAQPAQSIIPPSSSTLQDAAVQLGHDYDNLYRAKDAAAMANLYSANGELVSPGAKLITGHADRLCPCLEVGRHPNAVCSTRNARSLSSP
jgi:hypothetical protein